MISIYNNIIVSFKCVKGSATHLIILMNELRILTKKYSIENQANIQKLMRHNKKKKYVPTTTKPTFIKIPVRPKTGFTKKCKSKNGQIKQGTKTSREDHSKIKPEAYFNMLNGSDKTTLEATLMNLLFGKKLDVSDNNVRAENQFDEESIEMVKLGKSVHFSKAIISHISDTQKSGDLRDKISLLNPLDLNTSNTTDCSIRNLKSYIKKLNIGVLNLNIQQSRAQEINGYLKKIHDILDDEVEREKKKMVSKTFTDQINTTQNV